MVELMCLLPNRWRGLFRKLGESLGKGSCGRVWIARNVDTGEYSAVKKIKRMSHNHKVRVSLFSHLFSSLSVHRSSPIGINVDR